jgi:hypothetical protein
MRQHGRPFLSEKAHIWPTISLPPAFWINVSCDQSAGTIASSAPRSMKITPEPVFQCANFCRLFPDDEAGSADHGHKNLSDLVVECWK